MSSNLPPGCGQLPGEVDDGVTPFQEELLGWLDANSLLPEIVRDQLIEIVHFYEKCDPMTDADLQLALAAKLKLMATALHIRVAVQANG